MYMLQCYLHMYVRVNIHVRTCTCNFSITCVLLFSLDPPSSCYFLLENVCLRCLQFVNHFNVLCTYIYVHVHVHVHDVIYYTCKMYYMYIYIYTYIVYLYVHVYTYMFSYHPLCFCNSLYALCVTLLCSCRLN